MHESYDKRQVPSIHMTSYSQARCWSEQARPCSTNKQSPALTACPLQDGCNTLPHCFSLWGSGWWRRLYLEDSEFCKREERTLQVTRWVLKLLAKSYTGHLSLNWQGQVTWPYVIRRREKSNRAPGRGRWLEKATELGFSQSSPIP
jgi:hypothetical protein